MRSAFLAALCLTVSAPAGAAPADELRFTHLRQAQGLSTEGRLWVGTDRGLNRLDRERRIFTRFAHDAADPRSLASDHVAAVFVDGRGDVWIGTGGGGLGRLDPAGGFVRYRSDPSDATSIGSDVIRVVFEDGRGDLWVGIGRRRQGLDFLVHPPGRRWPGASERLAAPRYSCPRS